MVLSCSCLLCFRRISTLAASGLLLKLEKVYWPKDANRCKSLQSSSFGHFGNDIKHTYGAFIVLGLGLFMSCLVLLAEVLFDNLGNILFLHAQGYSRKQSGDRRSVSPPSNQQSETNVFSNPGPLKMPRKLVFSSRIASNLTSLVSKLGYQKEA